MSAVVNLKHREYEADQSNISLFNKIQSFLTPVAEDSTEGKHIPIQCKNGKWVPADPSDLMKCAEFPECAIFRNRNITSARIILEMVVSMLHAFMQHHREADSSLHMISDADIFHLLSLHVLIQSHPDLKHEQSMRNAIRKKFKKSALEKNVYGNHPSPGDNQYEEFYRLLPHRETLEHVRSIEIAYEEAVARLVNPPTRACIDEIILNCSKASHKSSKPKLSQNGIEINLIAGPLKGSGHYIYYAMQMRTWDSGYGPKMLTLIRTLLKHVWLDHVKPHLRPYIALDRRFLSQPVTAWLTDDFVGPFIGCINLSFHKQVSTLFHRKEHTKEFGGVTLYWDPWSDPKYIDTDEAPSERIEPPAAGIEIEIENCNNKRRKKNTNNNDNDKNSIKHETTKLKPKFDFSDGSYLPKTRNEGKATPI